MSSEPKQEYACKDCGLHYEDEKLAYECYEFCTKNKACSIEIMKHSTEHKKMLADREKM